jgi:protein-glutamine gamma-glutamyltransferase
MDKVSAPAVNPAAARLGDPLARPLARGIERYFQASLFAMILTGFVALAGTGKLDGISLLFVLVALGVRAFHLATGSAFQLSEKTTTRLTIAYAAFYLFDYLALSRNFVSATVHLVLFIMVVKLFSLHRDRDHIYLAVISFLMILSAAILTIDTFFFGAFCLFLLVSVSTFTSMEMRRSLRNTPRTATQDERSHSTPKRLARSLAVTAAVLVVTIVLGATGIFFMLPRVTSSYLQAYARQSEFMTGFSDEVKLGEIGRIQQSSALVAHIKFAPGVRPPADMKWRGIALSNFDGSRWFNRTAEEPIRAPMGLDLQRSWILQRVSGLAMPPRRPETMTYRVVMEPIGTSIFFLLPRPMAVRSNTRTYGVDALGTIYSVDGDRQISVYEGVADISNVSQAARVSTDDVIPPFVADLYLQLPAVDPRVVELARKLTAKQTTIYAKAAAIEQHLKNSYGYTLELDSAGNDPIAYFLFTRRKGHCEYFASSMAVMLRSVGIAARVVNGFRGGEFNDVSGSYVLRGRDAHSWVEVYVPGYGWQTFDPTPPSVAPPRDQWARMLLYMDAAREFWREWVVNYDFTRQNTVYNSTVRSSRNLFGNTRTWLSKTYAAMLDRARKVQRLADRDPQKWGARGIIVIAIVLVLANIRRMIAMIRERRLAGSPGRAPKAAATIWYERMVRFLGRRGIPKTATQTPEEYLRSIEDELLQARVARFTESYEQARFGDSAEEADKLPELFEEIEEVMRR